MKITGKDVRKLRKGLKMSEREFAYQLGITIPTLRNWELRNTNLSSLSERAMRALQEKTREEEKAISEEIREKGIPLKI